MRQVPGADTLGTAHTGAEGQDVIVAKHSHGACIFFDGDGHRLCAIHTVAGERALPVSCRNFPRVSLKDPRGVFVTLSHYCPTAAGMLLDAGDIAIVDAPDTIALGGDVEGLDATSVLPPLLRPGILMDFDGYSAWEREGVAALNVRACSPATALAVIRRATREVLDWSPGSQSLATHVRQCFARARLHAGGSVSCDPLDHPRKAFLASHLFASWAAYQHGGLEAVVEALDLADSLLGNDHADAEAFIAAARAADLRLRHTGDHVGTGSIPALRHG